MDTAIGVNAVRRLVPDAVKQYITREKLDQPPNLIVVCGCRYSLTTFPPGTHTHMKRRACLKQTWSQKVTNELLAYRNLQGICLCVHVWLLMEKTPQLARRTRWFLFSLGHLASQTQPQTRSFSGFFGCDINFTAHFNYLTKTFFYHLCNITKVRPLLSQHCTFKFF